MEHLRHGRRAQLADRRGARDRAVRAPGGRAAGSSRTSCSTSGRTWPRRPTSQARHPVPTVEPRHIEKLERLIDELNEVVGPLDQLPAAGRLAGRGPAPRRADGLPPGRARGDRARPRRGRSADRPPLPQPAVGRAVRHGPLREPRARRRRAALEARGLMSVLLEGQALVRRIAGEPTTPSPPEPHLSRHERREAGRERHHKTGEPAWEAQRPRRPGWRRCDEP